MAMNNDVLKKFLEALPNLKATDIIKQDFNAGKWFGLRGVAKHLVINDLCCVIDERGNERIGQYVDGNADDEYLTFICSDGETTYEATFKTTGRILIKKIVQTETNV